MSAILCATSNTMKFNIGKDAFEKFGLELEQVVVDIDEIQSEDPNIIIKDKVNRAYESVEQPVIVTDDSWSIPGLNGFPGPYMKSINHWFTPDDFIRLTKDLKDRSVFINQYVAYKDEYEVVVFRHDIPGVLLGNATGSYGPPITKVVSLDLAGGLSISETYDQGKSEDIHGIKNAWHQLAEWYQNKTSL